MDRIRSASSRWSPIALPILLCLALTAIALARATAEDRAFHHGRIEDGSATDGSMLRMELRAVEYQRAVNRVRGGRSTLQFPRSPATKLDLWLRNDGDVPIARPFPAEASVPSTSAGPYLIDEHGRRYPAQALQWHQRPGEPESAIGRLLPGWGVGLTFHFPGIPVDVRDLTLVVGPIEHDSTASTAMRLTVPLP